MTNQMPALVHIMNQLVRPRPGYRFVFTYDGMMAEATIRELCPDPRFVMVARYLSKRWIINDDGVATLVPRRGYTVWGVIWEISEVDQTGLDIFMGVPSVFDRFGSFARAPATDELIASEYYGARNNRTFGKGSIDYLARIIDAARHWNFPAPYIEEIAAWSQSSRRAATATRGAR